MKLTADLLKQIIREAKREKEQIFKSDLSSYEIEDLDTDNQTIAVLGEILNQLKTLVYYSTPAKSAIGAELEKGLAQTIQEDFPRDLAKAAELSAADEILDDDAKAEVMRVLQGLISKYGAEGAVVEESALQIIEDLIRQEISNILNEKEI